MTSQLFSGSLARLIEGIRLQRVAPGSRLILSGGGAFDPVPNALVMADHPLVLGVRDADMVLLRLSKDTKDEARFIQAIVGRDRFVLVTAASHMPRSVALFEKLAMQPIPAPTDHQVKERERINPGLFFPSFHNLDKSEKAIHEYLGLIWARIRDQV